MSSFLLALAGAYRINSIFARAWKTKSLVFSNRSSPTYIEFASRMPLILYIIFANIDGIRIKINRYRRGLRSGGLVGGEQRPREIDSGRGGKRAAGRNKENDGDERHV